MMRMLGKIILIIFCVLIITTTITESVSMSSGMKNDSANSLARQSFTCHCDICIESNFMCQTTDFCFISREIFNGKEIIRQRCYEKIESRVYEFPAICEISYATPSITANCCKGNKCNDESILPPPPPTKKISTVIQDPLKCHCSHCTSTHFMCVTDGFCYLTWKKSSNDGLLVFTQGCYDRQLFFPPDNPTFCENHQLNQPTTYGRLCCKNSFCNAEDLKSDTGLNVYALFFFVAFIISMLMIFYLNLR